MIEVKPVFVKTRNVRNFSVMMDGLRLGDGEGRLGLVYGRAGRGKSRTSQWWHANNGGIYLRMQTVWRSSELAFLQALCAELGLLTPPARKAAAFAAAVEVLMARPRPVFLDEIEKMPRYFLDVVRDLTDMTTAPFVLVGEEELVSYMKVNRRVWSRTFRSLEFAPIGPADIIAYGRETCGLALTAAVAEVIHRASGGDFRVVRRDLIHLVADANARGSAEVDVQMAEIATARGLSG